MITAFKGKKHTTEIKSANMIKSENTPMTFKNYSHETDEKPVLIIFTTHRRNMATKNKMGANGTKHVYYILH
jgi:hypothetical protein